MNLKHRFRLEINNYVHYIQCLGCLFDALKENYLILFLTVELG